MKLKKMLKLALISMTVGAFACGGASEVKAAFPSK